MQCIPTRVKMLVKASGMMVPAWKAVCWGWEEAEAGEVSLGSGLATQ